MAGLFIEPKTNDSVIFTSEAGRKYFGQVEKVDGQFFYVRLKDPKCLVQAKVHQLKVRK